MSASSRYQRSTSNPFAHKRKMSFASQQKVSEMKAAFSLFDEDGSGAIDKHELMKAIRELGHEDITMAQVEMMLKNVDKSESGEINFDEFVILVETNLQSLEMDGDRMDDISDEEFPDTPAFNPATSRPSSSLSGTADFAADLLGSATMRTMMTEDRFREVRDKVVKAVVKCQNGAHLDTVLENDLADVSRGELGLIIGRLRDDLNEMMERASSLCSLMLDFDERINVCREQQRELSTKFDQESQSLLEDLRTELPFLQRRRVETERAMFDVQAQQKLLDKLYPYMQALAIQMAKLTAEEEFSDEEWGPSEEPSPPGSVPPPPVGLRTQSSGGTGSSSRAFATPRTPGSSSQSGSSSRQSHHEEISRRSTSRGGSSAERKKR